MFTLRFQRQGKKKDFVFRVVAIDSHFAINSGKAKEILGWWDPRRDTFNLKKERILYWLQQGAQPSDSCYNLLVRAKIIEGKKRKIKIRPKKQKKGASEEESAAAKAEQPAAKTEKPAEATKKEEKAEAENKAEAETKPETKPETKEEKMKEEKPGEKKEEVKEKSEKKEEEK